MFHPTVPDLSKVPTEELVTKIEELWYRGARMRQHPAHAQIASLIHHYTAELDRRRFNKKDKETG